jgi:ABC-type dipeptide/oligopeptide/nickel transport system permease subunit
MGIRAEGLDDLPSAKSPALRTRQTTDVQVDPTGAGRRRLRRAFHHRSLAIGVFICVVVVAMVVAAPLLTSASPTLQHPTSVFDAPSASHLMGTDSFGRDVLARVLYGGRATLLASVSVVLIGGTVGTLLGLIAGYFGGVVGFLIMRLIDLMLAFPGILLALAVAAILGPGLEHGVLAVAVVLVPIYCRVIEGATKVASQLPYVSAARTLGAGHAQILVRHVVPNVLSSIVVLTTSWVGVAALWIAGLGFLGLGVQPPAPEWGAIMNDGSNYLTIAWWITFFPGVFLALFIIGTNLIGDGLRDELDPTLNRR